MRYITKLLKNIKFLLAISIILLSFKISHSDELMGQEIFVAECVGCHQIKPPKEGVTVTDLLQQKAPPLRYAGSKFKRSFLLKWLTDPTPIRALEYNSLTTFNNKSHKRLTGAQAEDVTSYLMTLRIVDTRPIKVEPLKIEPKVTLLAKQLFSQRYSCYACHQVRTGKEITGGLSGPSLVNVGERLNPQWIYIFLSDPRKISPKGSMPSYEGIIDEADLLELTKYLASFK